VRSLKASAAVAGFKPGVRRIRRAARCSSIPDCKLRASRVLGEFRCRSRPGLLPRKTTPANPRQAQKTSMLSPHWCFVCRSGAPEGVWTSLWFGEPPGSRPRPRCLRWMLRGSAPGSCYSLPEACCLLPWRSPPPPWCLSTVRASAARGPGEIAARTGDGRATHCRQIGCARTTGDVRRCAAPPRSRRAGVDSQAI
jgi:hypothetical protein